MNLYTISLHATADIRRKGVATLRYLDQTVYIYILYIDLLPKSI